MTPTAKGSSPNLLTRKSLFIKLLLAIHLLEGGGSDIFCIRVHEGRHLAGIERLCRTFGCGLGSTKNVPHSSSGKCPGLRVVDAA